MSFLYRGSRDTSAIFIYIYVYAFLNNSFAFQTQVILSVKTYNSGMDSLETINILSDTSEASVCMETRRPLSCHL